jgi:hypothetical protein
MTSVSGDMTTPRARIRRYVRRTVTSLGDLVCAIYDAAPGSAEVRARHTAIILSSSGLKRHLSRPIRVVP